MICRKCGKEISDDARFCKYCGTSMEENLNSKECLDKAEGSKNKTKHKTTETDGKHRHIIWAFFAILALIVIIGTAMFLSGRNGNEIVSLVNKNTITGDIETETDIQILELGEGEETAEEFSTEYETETETITEAAEGTNSSTEESGETESEETVYLLSRLYTTDYSEPSVTKQIEEYTYYDTGILKTEISTTYNADSFIIDKTVTDYDDMGNELLCTHYTHEGKISYICEYTYDENGNDLAHTYTHYYSNGEVHYTDGNEYTYDDNGNLLLDIDYTSTGGISSKNEYTYDENGNLLTGMHYTYDSEGVLFTSRKHEYTYDENGNELSYTYFYDDGETFVRNEYTYDATGNCLSCVVYNYSEGEIYSIAETVYDTTGNPLTTTHYNSKSEITALTEYTYDENGNQLTYIFYDSVDVISYRWEWSYDESGNCLNKIKYNSESEIVYKEEWTYDNDGNPLTYVAYDEDVLKEEQEYEYITLDETGIDIDVEGDTDTENFINLNNYYDYVLARGGDYMIVAKEIETVTNVIDYIGVLDTNYAWLVPLSENTILNPSGQIIEINGYSDFDSVCQQLQNCIVYAGDDLFVFCAESNNNYSSGYTINIDSFTWTEIGNFCTDTYKLSSGYLIMMNYDDKTIKIIDSSGSVTDTDIYCESEEFIGKYSEELFYSYDGFYDLEGNRVIDLSEYAGLITNHPYFSDGVCELQATNEKGTVFTGTIDTEGNFVSEFTEVVGEE